MWLTRPNYCTLCLMRTTCLPLSLGILALGILLASCSPQTTPPQAVDASASSAAAAAESMQPDHIVVTATDIRWVDAPPTLPVGAKVAVLEGDPGKPGPFTMRIMVPANYRIAPHYHPADEHVTVISGDFAIGMGETFNESALNALGAGSFAMMKTGTRHFARSKDGAVIQLHGVGPWGLTYVNAADDPRNQ